MACTKPTLTQPPTLPALRSDPSTFNDRQEASLTYQSQHWFADANAVIDYVECVKNEIAATALAGDLPDMTEQAGRSIRVNADGTGLEFDYGVPVGALFVFPAETPPAGYIKANGAILSRTTYAALFAVIGTTNGEGDGSTTFQIPDLRGEFLRGWDDGRGVDADRAFGSSQGDAIRNIEGYWAGNLLSSSPTNSWGSLVAEIQQTSQRYSYVGSGDYWGARLNFDASQVVPTADENRPRNIALLACIKY